MYEPFLGVNPWTALFILLNTLTIFFVARRYLFMPVMGIVARRQQEIENMYSAAEYAQARAEALEKEYRQKIHSARETADGILQEAVARGHAKEAEILRQAKSEAAAIAGRAAADVQREKKKAIREARQEISILAVTIAGKVVGQAVSEAGQRSIVDRFLDDLGADV